MAHSSISNKNITNFHKYSFNCPQGFQSNDVMNSMNNNRKGSGNLNSPEKFSTDKFTCKFEIQIENDNCEFQVARKIIGSKVLFKLNKGCNMKNIVESCKLGNLHLSEPVKLRLRGRGSGYKEGNEKKGFFY